ncbi:MAG TPA: RNA methyltransferase [Acidimicrobiales bacterium]|nr:RNA methyltransferase [Acidimicrobiales bacterium]
MRWREDACVLEGPDLVEAALASGAELEALYVDGARAGEARLAALAARAGALGVRTFALAPGVLERVADAVTPQGVLAAARRPLATLEEVRPGTVLVLADLRDPGNVGTLIRTADATGAAGVVLVGPGVDPTNPKALRASAGSIFHVPVVVTGLEEALGDLRTKGARVLASVARGGEDPVESDLAGPCALLIGNEAAGLAEEVVARCDGTLTIPMAGRAESLNAATAGAMLAYEAMVQRRLGRPARTF